MVARDDVPNDGRLPGPIEITVEEIQTQPRRPRDVEITATDEAGRELIVIIWKTHEVEQQWHEGQSYELSGARGKRFSGSDGERVELHSTKAFDVKEIDVEQSTRIFVLGDTHVGYRHRATSNKAEHARDVDGREVFTQCLDHARQQGVDAVVHAGDIFDHHSTRGDRKVVDREIRRAVESGIPFYYVIGNHDNAWGKQQLKSGPGIHLSGNKPTFGDPPVNIIGVDHSGPDFPSHPPEASIEMLLHKNIVVVHDTPYPVVDGDGDIIYNDVNRADLSEFTRDANFDIELVITGHLHVANRAMIRGFDIPVLVTGATIPISKHHEDSQASTWLVELSPDGLDIDRQPL